MRRRWIYKDGEAIEVTQDWTPNPMAAHHVMPDIQPYQSMIDGSMITSRSHHREHLRANDCIEVGNEKMKVNRNPTGSKEAVIRAVQEAKKRHGSRFVEREITKALQFAHEVQRNRR